MTKRLCRTVIVSALLSAMVFTSVAALAQTMPPPRSAPRTPVNRQALPDRKPAAPPSRDVLGQATIIDGEKLRIGDANLRLFGVVPPQLSASFGPQARGLLDTMVQGQAVACHVRDRDHDGRLLATCTLSNGSDLAIELVKHGLAVVARGSIAGTDLAQAYVNAEAAAQVQKVGLWSVQVPPAAKVAAVSAITETLNADSPHESTTPDIKVEDAKKEEPKEVKAETPALKPAPVAALPAPTIAPVVIPDAAASDDDMAILKFGNATFFAKFQILIAGFLMLATALAILVVFGYQRRAERREEMKAIAAALRGELMGARSVCQTRLRIIQTDDDDRNATWPRLRSTLYQAYVGRLGWLGAGLARQVASIYGQAADYASYYNAVSEETHSVMTSKRYALQTLLSHIEEILPRLAWVEKTGEVPQSKMPVSKAQVSGPDYPQTKPALPSAPQSTVSKPPVAQASAAQQTAAADAALHKMQETIAGMWENLRRFARDHLADRRTHTANDDSVADYTTLIEQEMATMSFGDGEDDPLAGDGSRSKQNGQ